MKIIKLRPSDARVWRENRSVLLDPEGNFVRHVTSTEARMLFAVGKQARHLRRACTAELTDEEGRPIVVEASPQQISRETLLLECSIDGMPVLDGREYFKQQVLAKHGECQLRSQNGQFMCTVRDPSVARPSPADASRTAPKPGHCHCKGWGQPEGRHHRICEWNLKAPMDERALDTDNDAYPAQLPPVRVKEEKPSILDEPVKAPQIMGMGNRGMVVGRPQTVPGAVVSPVVTPVAAKPVIPAPGACVCKDFPAAEGFEPGENHHPMCQWKDQWDATHAPEPMFLVNLETGKVGRQATSEEIKAARSEEGFVLIGETQYGVVTESEAKATRDEAESEAASPAAATG